MEYLKIYKLDNKYKRIGDHIYDIATSRDKSLRKGEKLRLNINCFVYNVCRSLTYNNDKLFISLTKGDYSYHECVNGRRLERKISYKILIKILGIMSSLGYIELFRGGFEGHKNGKLDLKESYFNILDPLKDLIASHQSDIFERRKDFLLPSQVLLRNIDHDPVSYKRSKDINEKINLVARYNRESIRHDIRLKDSNQTFNIQIKKIFLRSSFDLGGRSYTEKGEVQSMPNIKNEVSSRSNITIDGEPTVELDYKCLHPSICSELEGYAVGDHDFYDVDLGGYTKSQIRPFAKIALLIMINARDKSSARSALACEIAADRRRPVEYQDFSCFHDDPSKIREIIDKLEELNSFISDYFYSDKGVLLQNYDANIIDDINNHFLSKGEVVIPVHDSIIIKKRYLEEGMMVMRKAYKDNLKTDYNCNISIK